MIGRILSVAWKEMLQVRRDRLTLAIDEVFYAGSGAAARWSATASAQSGTSADFAGITVFEVDQDGRIQTVMSYWDPAAVLIQLAGGATDDEFVLDDD